jgi:hypothetical protein
MLYTSDESAEIVLPSVRAFSSESVCVGFPVEDQFLLANGYRALCCSPLKSRNSRGGGARISLPVEFNFYFHSDK